MSRSRERLVGVASRRPRVFVTRQLPGTALSRLAQIAELDIWPEASPPSPEVLRSKVRDAAGLVCMLTDRVDAALLDCAPGLRVVATVAVGYDNLDVAALTARRIPLGNTPGVLTEATADLAFALILTLGRRILEARELVLSGRWTTWDPQLLLGLEMHAATLGIVGTGRIGEAVARRARGFGMELLGWSPSRRPIEGLVYVDLDELLACADVVTLHASLNETTHHLIGSRELGLMRPNALLVNTARGALVDQQALVAALRKGGIAGAGLDVLETEPIEASDPLLALANCLVLPHIGSATVRTRERMADLAIDNVLAGLAGERLTHCVNPEVYGDAGGS